MLVLSRKVGERILVPDSNIAPTVVSVKGNRIRLGVSAPADVRVYRE
jgi:carbon storage regulator